MSSASNSGNDELDQVIQQGVDAENLPHKAQVKLEEAYATLNRVPQDRVATTGNRCASGNNESSQGTASASRRGTVSGRQQHRAHDGVRVGKRVIRKGMVIAIAAAIVALFGCTAYATSRLLEMQPGEASFFESGSNLPVYNSLKTGVSSLNAEVGETVVVDGVSVTLDTVSSDRNIVNLFFTLEKEGGFDLDAQSIYEGSQESEWARLQQIVPRLEFAISSNGEDLYRGMVNQLDAYREDGKIKCMQRIVAEGVLPDQVDVSLSNEYMQGDEGQGSESIVFDVGLDLSTVEQPREMGAQDLVFHTSEGDKTLNIERFTASELGTVFVVKNASVMSEDGMSYGPPEAILSPGNLKMTDDQGNVLNFVDAGDGAGGSPTAPYVVYELAGLSKDATSITFTPMLANEALDTIEGRRTNSDENLRTVDVSQIGTQLPTSEYGGYELTDWTVADNTVSITLEPYGWGANGCPELIASGDVTLLTSSLTDSETGETFAGKHSAIGYTKQDYLTGTVVQINSYYAATDEELNALHEYRYRSSFGVYIEEASAATTLAFSS